MRQKRPPAPTEPKAFRAAVALAMSEATLQKNIIEMARAFGWRACHFRPAMDRNGKWRTHMDGDSGFPDLILARAGRVIAAELKAEKGRVTLEQVAWLAELEGAVEAVVLRPGEWLDGTIQRMLERSAA